MKNTQHSAQHCLRTGLEAAKRQDWQRAAAAFAEGTRLRPDDLQLWLNLARTRLQAHEMVPATSAAERAVALAPAEPLARRLLAEIWLKRQRPDQAAATFEALPADAPRDADWYRDHANALYLGGQPQPAVELLFKALSLRIDSALLHYRLGLCFKELGMPQEAGECMRTAVALDDDGVRAMALPSLIYQSRQACDWRHLQEDTDALVDIIDHRPGAAANLSPFVLLPLAVTPAQQRRVGQLRLEGLLRGVQPLPPAPRQRRAGRVRLGYLSCDFHMHATATLIAELLERSDRSRFEVFIYSHGADDGSATGTRVRRACEHFVDVSALTDREIALRVRADEIDLLVDLKGHTRGSRFELMAYRPAPLQVAYLGYPGTCGGDFLDYLIGDPVVTPLAHAAHFSEKIAQLPHSYQPNDRQRALPEAPSRASLGLPEDAVVLCCFNQTYKFSPAMLDLWVRILDGAPRAVLWMLAWNPRAQANLQAELTARGVPPERVFWAPVLPLAEHIARLRCADLFLDTWPCNAHTTASEALWAGVPVLTVPGETFASRVATSLLSACELPQLACTDAEAYVQQAIALSNEPGRLHPLQQHLAHERMRLPLFDTPRYVADYEALLLRMFERHQAGLRPAALAATPT